MVWLRTIERDSGYTSGHSSLPVVPRPVSKLCALSFDKHRSEVSGRGREYSQSLVQVRFKCELEEPGRARTHAQVVAGHCVRPPVRRGARLALTSPPCKCHASSTHFDVLVQRLPDYGEPVLPPSVIRQQACHARVNCSIVKT